MKKAEIIANLKSNLTVTILIVMFMIGIPLYSITSKVDSNTEKTEINNNEVIEEKTIEPVVIEGNGSIKVYISSEKRIEEMNINDYLYGVVSSEMSPTFEMEALKAQAIAARTYCVNKLIVKCDNSNGADICDSTHCQVFKEKEVVVNGWTDSKEDEYWAKVKEAVDSTNGVVLSYNNELVKYPQFFSTSSGKTENCKDVFSGDIPYLVSIESLGEEISPRFTSTAEIPISSLVQSINNKYSNAKVTTANIKDSIEIVERSEAGGIKTIRVGGADIKGSEFRMLFELKSTNFTYKFDGDKIIFDCKGFGHGVGMSQWGANAMAKDGKTYEEILKHYYTGVDLTELKFKN